MKCSLGPGICINEKYTLDNKTWPEKAKRAWRAESDFTKKEAEAHLKKIKAKECNYIAATKNTLAALLDFLIEEEKSVFRNGLMELTKFQGEIGKDEWRTIVLILKQILKLYNITSY